MKSKNWVCIRAVFPALNSETLTSMGHAVIVISILIVIALLTQCGGGSQLQVSAPPLTITTATLPNGITGTAYSQTIQAAGGVPPFDWTLSSGTLPHNLSLSATTSNALTISGTPDTGEQGVVFTIQVKDSAGHIATQSYTLSVLLQSDSLVLSPASLDFANELVGSASAPLIETLTNMATSDLDIANIAMTGTNAAEFSQVASTCGAKLAAGANCAITLNFTPAQVGPRNAAITITDNTAGSPQGVSVSGTGVIGGPNATLSVSSLSFGTELVGTTSPAYSITLNNYGTMTLNIASISAATGFAEADNCIPSVAPGATCAIAVTFTPGGAGEVSGALSISDNATGSPQVVSLSGNGSTNTPPLTGYCFATCRQKTEDTSECPVGAPSITPGSAGTYPCGPIDGTVPVDYSRTCKFSPLRGVGHCVTQ